LFAGPTYLGQVPRSQVREEFRRADVFVLPTLAEGMALVHLEAMACGVPVITTPHCGSVVRHGVDGLIVPIRDSRALADSMERLINDRVIRQQYSTAARLRSQEFSWREYGRRLLDSIV
jgi:glycosyltransferase involved in cell wall biosynthesis